MASSKFMRTTFFISRTILIVVSISAVGLESFFCKKNTCQMMQHILGKSMASLFSHDEDPLNRTELILQEDSEDDLETTENDSVTFKEYFGESDDELNKSFLWF